MKTIAPPHPDPHRPRFKLPPGSCDAHCHVFGPAPRFPYAENRRYTPPDAPAEKLAALHRHLGISRAVLVQASAHGTDNRAMLDAIARDPENRRGVAMVDASIADEDLETLGSGGIRAVRYNFVRHLGGAPDYAVIRTMARRIAPLGWHLVLHVDAQDLVDHEAFLRSLDTPYVIDHMGRVAAPDGLTQRPFQCLLSLMRTPPAWVKVSGAERVSPHDRDYADAIPFARELVAAAPDRVLWGTDWPHPNVRAMPDDGDLVDLVPLLAPDEVTRTKLLVDNPTRLYWKNSRR
jgi:predicted TIM-barrel fold metal-dependent hydrolase